MGERVQFLTTRDEPASASEEQSRETVENSNEYKTPDVSEVKLEPEEDDFPF